MSSAWDALFHIVWAWVLLQSAEETEKDKQNGNLFVCVKYEVTTSNVCLDNNNVCMVYNKLQKK